MADATGPVLVGNQDGLLDQPAAGALTVRYRPDDEEVHENPPRFVWMPTLDESSEYVIRVSACEDNGDSAATIYPGIRRNFFTPHHPFAPGRYRWRYAVWDPQREVVASNWSSSRSFAVPDGLTVTALPLASDRRARADLRHPRLWLGPDGAAAFAEALRHEPNHCGFQSFYERSVAPWIDRGITAEPLPYPDNKRLAEIWRRVYIECQETLYAIRHLAIAGRLLDDEALAARAKAWLLSIAAWDVHGTTSRAYNDEAAFRVATALAWGYDWLHDRLDASERELVRRALLERTREIAEHVIDHARIHVFPFDSHAVRALSAVLVPCCIALLDEAPEAQEWLDFTTEYLFSIYSPWGGKDGGWAEGPHYWTTGMAYLLEGAGLLRNYLGVDLLGRAFFQRTGDFPLYTKAPGARRVSVGDDSTLGDLPSLKVGYNVRQFAAATGNPHYQWYFERVRKEDPGTEGLFYNYGWWDFAFEDLIYAHDRQPVAAASPNDLPAVRRFDDVGWVAVQRHMDDPSRHLQFLFKSSPYGSLSHSHADQNAFLLRACGEDLAIQSGYYVAFGSTMHRNWRRQTLSKNAVLIDGIGQYAGRDKAAAKSAAGRLVEVRESAGVVFMRGDATAAYRPCNAAVQLVQRDVHVVGDRYLVIVDRVELEEARTMQWLFHAEHEMELGSATFRVRGNRAGLYGHFVLSTGGKPALRQAQGFDGVDEAEIAGLPKHWHLTADVPASRRHSLVTLLVPYPREAPRRILHFIDDQGFDWNVSFVDEDDNEYSVTLPKDF
ncbi:MAG TPA: DUF4962 domain-containing protein [Beijerinckiaceae bacterium]|nr:DUF4962 domain-containing protein [Beijerinckiaceae bacterium]